jgi:hypothetical protein
MRGTYPFFSISMILQDSTMDRREDGSFPAACGCADSYGVQLATVDCQGLECADAAVARKAQEWHEAPGRVTVPWSSRGRCRAGVAPRWSQRDFAYR